MCNFLGSVSLQHKFEMACQCYGSVTAQFKWWISVTALLQLSFIWHAKENISSRGEGGPKEREGLDFGSSFSVFSPSPEPALCK